MDARPGYDGSEDGGEIAAAGAGPYRTARLRPPRVVSGRRRAWRVGARAVVALALLAAATTAGVAGARAARVYIAREDAREAWRGFARCMREHGVVRAVYAVPVGAGSGELVMVAERSDGLARARACRAYVDAAASARGRAVLAGERAPHPNPDDALVEAASRYVGRADGEDPRLDARLVALVAGHDPARRRGGAAASSLVSVGAARLGSLGDASAEYDVAYFRRDRETHATAMGLRDWHGARDARACTFDASPDGATTARCDRELPRFEPPPPRLSACPLHDARSQIALEGGRAELVRCAHGTDEVLALVRSVGGATRRDELARWRRGRPWPSVGAVGDVILWFRADGARVAIDAQPLPAGLGPLPPRAPVGALDAPVVEMRAECRGERTRHLAFRTLRAGDPDVRGLLLGAAGAPSPQPLSFAPAPPDLARRVPAASLVRHQRGAWSCHADSASSAHASFVDTTDAPGARGILLEHVVCTPARCEGRFVAGPRFDPRPFAPLGARAPEVAVAASQRDRIALAWTASPTAVHLVVAHPDRLAHAPPTTLRVAVELPFAAVEPIDLVAFRSGFLLALRVVASLRDPDGARYDARVVVVHLDRDGAPSPVRVADEPPLGAD